MVNKNLHVIDRILRIILSVVFIYYGFFSTAWSASEVVPVLLGVFGGINLVVAAIGFCPFYAIAGIDMLNNHDDD